MLKKFNIKAVEKELQAINEANNINTNAAIQLILNNLNLYNEVLKEYQDGDTKKVYLLYQLNGQIFKQLKEFNILPSAIKNKDASEDLDSDFMAEFRK